MGEEEVDEVQSLVGWKNSPETKKVVPRQGAWGRKLGECLKKLKKKEKGGDWTH